MNFPAVVVSWPLFALFVRWSAASVPHQRKSVPERCTYCLSGWCWWNSSCTKEIAFGSFVLWLASYSFGNRDLYPAHRIHYCQLRSGKQRFIIAIYAPVTVRGAVNLLSHFRIPTSRSHALCTYLKSRALSGGRMDQHSKWIFEPFASLSRLGIFLLLLLSWRCPSYYVQSHINSGVGSYYV